MSLSRLKLLLRSRSVRFLRDLLKRGSKGEYAIDRAIRASIGPVRERNARHLGQVQVFPGAFGEQDGTIDMLYSDAGTNFGGFSRFEAGSDAGRRKNMEDRCFMFQALSRSLA